MNLQNHLSEQMIKDIISELINNSQQNLIKTQLLTLHIHVLDRRTVHIVYICT